jgi:hypothetical protein
MDVRASVDETTVQAKMEFKAGNYRGARRVVGVVVASPGKGEVIATAGV